MFQIDIDGRRCDAEEGEMVLEVARRHGIAIPTLCHHEGLEPYGACRLCIVEVSQKGRARLESSCTRPVEAGMTVRTDTEEIRAYRALIAELLLARCPNSERIRRLAREVGVSETRFEPLDEDCVLCGLCVRACQDALGVSAIGFMNRGMDRKVSTPFEINSDVCVGCGACARVCPTGAITVEDIGDKRIIRYFNTELTLQHCTECGAAFTTQRRRERVETERPMPGDMLALCPTCRRRQAAASLRRYAY